ncbi:MAG: asparagine synthase [Tissierellia bacterium]|nr:asparagine synthase [Tissierellia bacterium]MDD4781878.1 asparagine synthase [Tissierellia bacterium]
MYIKDGLIPTVLGTAVTATGLALRKTNLPESYRNGIIGFGLAHVVLGSIDLLNNNNERNKLMNKMSKTVSFK